MDEVKLLKDRIGLLETKINALMLSDRLLFKQKVQILDGRDFQLGTETGTKFGTAVEQKLAFHGIIPSIQQSKINDPSGQATDLDAEARTAINSIIDVLENKGFTAT